MLSVAAPSFAVGRRLLADEEAKEARARKLNENRAVVNAAKAEAGANALKRQQEIEHRRAHQRSLVLDVQTQREKPALAAEELVKHNRARAQELREQTERLEAQVREHCSSQMTRGVRCSRPHVPGGFCASCLALRP